jgi:cysteine desulfurase
MEYYFDWAATSFSCELNNNQSFLANPSSKHRKGQLAKEALEDARSRCAKILNVAPDTLYFTSGATESNCISIYSNLFRPIGRTVCSEIEHPSVIENIYKLQKLNKPISFLPADSSGIIEMEKFKKTIDKYNDIRFAAIMAVNNEIGIINAPKKIKEFLSQQNPPIHFHCDAVQAIGKIPINLSDCDSAAISAHKFSGPRGIGLLYLKKPFETLYSGGNQENKIRPGTENIHGALLMAQCLEKYAGRETVIENYKKADERINFLIESLLQTCSIKIIPEARIKNPKLFSPYILQLAITDIPGEAAVRQWHA